MIFYFSGTGNSLYVAKNIARHNRQRLISISAAMNSDDESFEYGLSDDEIVGFIYPIHSWGPPTIVLDFIEKLKLTNYRHNYVFSVATCGGSIGNTLKILRRHLEGKGISLDSGFSISMPSNLLVIGNTDSPELQRKKLSDTEKTLERLNRVVERRLKGEFLVARGFVPWFLTGVLNPMFTKHTGDTSKFFTNENCRGCGTCAAACSRSNITVEEKPHWGDRCILCHACINYCPARAIQFSKNTIVKGRYVNPNIGFDEIVRTRSERTSS